MGVSIIYQQYRYQIQKMKLLSNEQSLYTQQQLHEIDLIIQNKMDLHLEELMRSRMVQLLQQETQEHHPPSTLRPQLALELNVCNMVNRINELSTAKQDHYYHTIQHQKQEISHKQTNIAEKDRLISTLNSSIQQKDETINQLTKQKHALNSALMLLRQEINQQKANSSQERLTQQTQIQEKTSQLQILTFEMSQKASKSNELTQQNERLKEELRKINEELALLQQFLMEDSQRIKLNLMTSNILVNQINQTHTNRLKELEKYMSIHQQQMQIVKILNKVSSLAKVNQFQIEQYQNWPNQSFFVNKQVNIFDSISEFSSNINKMIDVYQKAIAEVEQKDNQIDQIQKDIKRLNCELEASQQQSKELRENMQAVSRKLKQQQNSNYELRQQIMNIKSNLQIMVKTQGDEQDCNYNIVQQLIEKNSDITTQLTLKKMEIQLKLQTIQYQNNLIDKSNLQMETLAIQNQALSVRLNQMEKKFQQKVLKDEKFSLQINSLKQKINYLSKKHVKKIDTQVQTEQQTIQSRIKKQIHRQTIRKSIQKSHSLLSQRQQNKQNSQKYINKVSLSTGEKQSYKDKIMTLNEIINFMMNYSKGLYNGQIRRGSWFMSQASKYGQQYEEKLMHPSNINSKLKNAKFIDTLCKQDSNCNKLIKQFQAIIDFYLARSHKLNSTIQCQSSYITQDKLSKTINKCRQSQQSSHIF